MSERSTPAMSSQPIVEAVISPAPMATVDTTFSQAFDTGNPSKLRE
jgi:hypothetical protein